MDSLDGRNKYSCTESNLQHILSVEYECEESPHNTENTTKGSLHNLLPDHVKKGHGERKPNSQNGRNDFNKGRLYEEMGIATAKCGNISEALSLYDLALHVKRKEYKIDDTGLIPTLLNRARAFREIDLSRSCLEYKKIIDLAQKRRSQGTTTDNISENDELFLAQVHIELAHVQCQRGDFEYGIANFHSALAIQIGHVSCDHEEVAFVWYLIGRAHHIKRDYAKALDAYKNSLKLLQDSNSKNERNKVLIHSIQRLLSDRTMLANVSTKHWSDNTI